MNKKVIVLLMILGLFITGWSCWGNIKIAFNKNKTNPHMAGIISTVSLAYSYNSLQELTEASDLVVEVIVKGIEKEVPKIDSSYYAVHVENTIKGKAEQDIIVKQDGIQTEEEKSGKIRVWRDSPLMNIGDQYILFLKKATEENTYYIAGEYQGKYKIVEEKVYSVDQDKEREAYVNGEGIEEFKEAVQKNVSSY